MRPSTDAPVEAREPRPSLAREALMLKLPAVGPGARLRAGGGKGWAWEEYPVKQRQGKRVGDG